MATDWEKEGWGTALKSKNKQTNKREWGKDEWGTEIKNSDRQKVAEDLARATQNRNKAKPATTIAGFRQLEAKQTVDIAQKAKQYSNAHPTYLNPYIPKEAAQLRLETPSDTAKRISGVAATGGTVGTLETIAKDASMFIPALPVAEKLLPKAAELIKTGNRENMAAIERKGKSMAGAKGTLGEDIAYGIGKETPAIVASYGGVGAVSKIPTVGKFLTGSGKVLETGRRGVAAGAIYTPLAEEDPTAKDYVENMAMFGVGDMGFTAAGKALKPVAGDVVRYTKQAVNESKPGELLNWRNVKGMEADSAKLRAQDMASVLMQELNKIPARKDFNPETVPIKKGMSGDDLNPVHPKEADNFDFLMDDAGDFSFALDDAVKAKPNFTVEPTGRTHVGDQQPELPAGNIPLALPEGRTRFQATPDGKVMDVQNGSYPLAKVEGVDYAADTSLGNRQRIAQDIDQPIPRSDVGDPAYLKGLEGKYNELVNAEVNRLKGQVQGVVKYMPGEDAPLLRSSMNAKWYRDFYAKNGRQPHEGEYRDMAINNLTRGVEDDFEGAIAPNQEFLSTLSELSRGQKLPEEWHGLQQSVRELEGAKVDQDIPVTADSVKVGDTVYNQSGEPLKVLSIVNKNTMRAMDQKGNRAPIKFSEVRAENKEIDPLVTEMKTEQAKIEPFGLNRDMGRLSEIENAFRNKTGMKDQADFRDYEAVNFKADANSDQDLKILRAAFEKRSFGLFKTQAKVDLAPEALERPEYQAAGVIADKLGLRLVPFKGNGARGAQKGRTIYVNEKLDDPLDYIFWHEVGHSMKNTHFDHYLNLLEISLDHVENGKAIRKHYTSQDYKEIEVPDEFAADIFAESLSTPGFFAKVADKAPELLKPLLEAIGRMVENIKGMISKDDSLLPYLKDVEGLRERIKQEVAMPYFKDAMSEKEFAKTFGDSWTESAAKVKGEANFKLSQQNPLEDIKAMVEHGAEIIGKDGLDFAKALEERFPEQLAGYSPEMKSKMINTVFSNAKKLNESGSVEIKIGQNAVQITKPVQENITPQSAPAVNVQPEQPMQPVDVSKINTASHIVSKTKRPPLLVKQMANNVYVAAIDDVFRLNQFDKFVQEHTGKALKPTEQSYKLALNSRGSDQVARTILEDNLVDSQGNVVDESLKSIVGKIPKGKENLFEDYLVHRHAPAWTNQGRKVFPESWNITPEVSESMVKNYEKYHPELKQIGDELIQWQRDMGEKWLVDTGLITPETWKVFKEKYPDYIPLQRKMTELEQSNTFGGSKRGYANQTNPVKKAEGSERQIISPIESIIEHVDKYVKTAKRNQVMQVLIENIKKDPEAFQAWAEIVPEKRGKELDNLLNSGDLDGFIAHMEKGWDEIAAQNQARQGLDKANVVTGIVNGEKVHVRVNDIGLLEALTNLNPQASNSVVEVFRQATRVMKLFTTGINPMFSIARNAPRDFIMGYIAGGESNPLRYAWDYLDSFARVVTNEKWHPDKFYQQYKAMGGGHSSSIASDRNLLAESKARILGANTPKQVGNAILSPLERLANATETVPRLPEYIRAVKEGGDTFDARTEGLYRANDVTVNFNKRGKVGKEADAFVPYLNAALQGIDKLVRIFKENPKEGIAKSMVAITIPSIGLYLINRDDPAYQKLSSWVKDNNFCIPRGDGTFIKIAKPREAGIVFGSMIERTMARWADDDPEGFKHFAAAWKTNFMPPTRPLWAPLNDVEANKDFADRPIVPGYMQGRSPALQYDETTSAPAKAIGEMFNVSPKNIDYLASSYGGVVSDVLLPAASQGRGQNVLQRVSEPIKRGLVADPVYSNDVMNDFYTMRDKLQTAKNDFKATGDKSEDYKPGLERRFNSAATKISDINRQIRNLNSNKNITYEAKQKRIKVLKERAVKIAESAMNSAD